MNKIVKIGGRSIGPGRDVYVVAELSANHNSEYDKAVALVEAAHAAGADAVKVQTYTADTMTIDCDLSPFLISGGTPWDGRTLYELYEAAQTPWEWHPKLKKVADRLGIHFFSSPFDHSAVQFLQDLDVPAYKIASAELVDAPLLRAVAATGKPVIVSTGMSTGAEVAEAVDTVRQAGGNELILLKCLAAYPAAAKETNLGCIPELQRQFRIPVGLSDHTLGAVVPIAAVALGACLIEKHLTLSRADGGEDASFSLEPNEFKEMVDAVRSAQDSLGNNCDEPAPSEVGLRRYRRSLFAVGDIEAGEPFTTLNVRSIRPGLGLPPKRLDDVLGKKASKAIRRGTPLDDSLID